MTEEKKILKEIRLLEGTRDKVIANEAVRAKIKEAMGHKDDIQDQVKVIRESHGIGVGVLLLAYLVSFICDAFFFNYYCSRWVLVWME